MAVYDTGGSTPEWLSRGLSKELQDHLKESNWRASTNPTGATDVPRRSCKSGQPASTMPHDPNDPDDGSHLCPNDILLGRALSHIPQGPFRHTKNPRHRVKFVQKIMTIRFGPAGQETSSRHCYQENSRMQRNGMFE